MLATRVSVKSIEMRRLFTCILFLDHHCATNSWHSYHSNDNDQPASRMDVSLNGNTRLHKLRIQLMFV